MKFSSIIFSAAAVVPAFLSGTAANYLPDSHPCADACQVHRHVCSKNESPHGLWKCLCQTDQPLLQGCASCLKHASSHPSPQETALIVVVRLLGATCPEYQFSPGPSMPKLSNEALKRTFDRPDQFVDSFLKLFQDEDDDDEATEDPNMIPAAAINDTSSKVSAAKHGKAMDASQNVNVSMPSKWKPHLSNMPINATQHQNMTKGKKSKSKSDGYGEKTSDAAYWSAANGWFMALGAACLFLAV